MTLTIFNGKLHGQLPGWQFEPSDARGGSVYRKFEGYYPDKGGRLISPLIMRQAAAGYYAVGFDARALERGYQGVEFFDAGGKLLADCYDVVYPGPKRRYARVVYAMSTVAGMRVFFQARSKLEAWNLSVESVAPAMAAEYCDRVYAAMPPLKFQAPADSMRLLPRTAMALKHGRPWRVVMLGDSIMQDTFHSQFHALLKREFPKSRFEFAVAVRGSTGCWHYCMADKFKEYVLDLRPDLLMIGGISNDRPEYKPTGAAAIEIVINAAKAHLGCEALILSPALSRDTRKYDAKHPERPLPARGWRHNPRTRRRYAELNEMAGRTRTPLWDLTAPAYAWLYASGTPHEWHSRDQVHSSERGKQIIGRVLMEYFKTALGSGDNA